MKTVAGLLPGIDSRGVGGFVNVTGTRLAYVDKGIKYPTADYIMNRLPIPGELIPWDGLPDRILARLNSSKSIKPLVDGSRHCDLISYIGTWRKVGFNQDEIEVQARALNKDSSDPLPDDVVLKMARQYEVTEPNTPPNNPSIIYSYSNMPLSCGETRLERHKNVMTSSQDWGHYARQFDDFMKQANGRVDRREVAEAIGTKVTSHTFRELERRRIDEHKIRRFRRSPNLIEWINRDYLVTQLESIESPAMLDIRLPLGLDGKVAVPERSIFALAGITSSGKTSALLETADKNCQGPMPVYYWYNEMSESKLRLRIEDFPNLIAAQKAKRFFPIQEGNFSIADVLQPDAINIYDYLDRDEELYLIAQDLKTYFQSLGRGIVVVGLQKKAGQTYGYGGAMTAKLTNLYVTLDSIDGSPVFRGKGRARIVKAKDWASEQCPLGFICNYHTGGKHGKLFNDGDWHHG